MTRRPSALPWPLLLAAALMLGYLVGPLITLLIGLPDADARAFLGEGAGPALLITLIAATVATLMDGVLGIPLGYWLSQTRSSLRHFVAAAVLIPLAMPPVVGGLVLLLWLGPAGWPGRWLDAVGLDPMNTLAGTILAQMFVAAPFIVISARSAFASLDPALEDAARSLGCDSAAALRRVLLPAARRGIVTGLLLGWVRCLGEFGATAIVAYHPYTLPVLTFVRLTEEGLPTALPAGALLALVGSVAAGGMLWLDASRPGRRVGAMLSVDPPDRSRALDWIRPHDSLAVGKPLAVEARLDLGGFRLDAAFTAPPRVIAILGASGAGKSLVLRVLAGLVEPEVGQVEIGGRTLLNTRAGVRLPAERRGLAYVAQRDALFENLDVAGNVGFALDRVDDTVRWSRVDELIAWFGLGHVRHADPRTLSGGERQRVAFARALAASPAALLLDEPFSALDTVVRQGLRTLVREIHQRTGLPIVLVTHDHADVFELADVVVVLDRGRVVQQGAVEEVFARPATRAVAALLGIPNVMAVHRLRPAANGRFWAATDWGDLLVLAPGAPAPSWELAVPVDAITLDPAGAGAYVESSRLAAGGWRVRVRRITDGATLEALLPRDRFSTAISGDQHCAVSIDASRCHLMPSEEVGTPLHSMTLATSS